jgi:hypothetical protein
MPNEVGGTSGSEVVAVDASEETSTRIDSSADVAMGSGGSAMDASGDVSRRDAAALDATALDGCGVAACAPECTAYVYGAHTFAFCQRPYTYSEAKALCATMQMHLVKIEDAAENEWLNAVANPTGTEPPIWIGTDDLTVPGDFFWPDGTQLWTGGATGHAVGGLYTNWQNGAPRDMGDCAYISVFGTWFATKCTSGLRALCESN